MGTLTPDNNSLSTIITHKSHGVYYTIYVDILTILIWIIAFAIAITVHEAAHAWMANRLGDPTARLQGRLTLNPIAHYDPVGTTLLLLMVIMRSLGAPVIPFGWAKPVPVDPYNLQNPKKDSALISLAGPLSNLILAAILAIVLRIYSVEMLLFFFYPPILLNVSLAIFNLLPIHPLDGGKILVGLLPHKEAMQAEYFLEKFGFILLFLLIVSPVFSMVISPLIGLIMHILIPQFGVI